jgi:PAS domain S-box-containing protein
MPGSRLSVQRTRPWRGRLRAPLVAIAAASAVMLTIVATSRPSHPASLAATALLLAGGLGAAHRFVGSHRRRSLRDRVPVALYTTTPEGDMREVNPALARLLGCEDPDELRTIPAQDFYADAADRARWLAAIDGAVEPVESTYLMRRRDETLFWARDRVIPRRNRRGRVVCYDGLLEDVTEAKRNREELEATLSSRIRFIGTVSHELRTPLTSVIGYLKLLREEPSLTNAERDEMLAIVEQQAEDLAEIVEDLLAAAQVEAGNLLVFPRQIDLAHETSRVVAGMKCRHAHDIEVDAAVTRVLADPVRVRQIVRNLVANALVHGGEAIRVAVACDEGRARVTVADDGPGPDPEEAEKIFEAFERGSRSPARPGSVGLGLNISRHLARQMGGDLLFDRSNGETRFHLLLPADSEAPQHRATAPAGCSRAS